VRSINPLASVLQCTRGEVADPLSLVGSAKGEGAATMAFIDEHRKMLAEAEKESKVAAAESCSSSNCQDPTHDHSHASHDHGHQHASASTCHDSTCTSHDHEHSHSHSHDHSHDCQETQCTDPTHNHDHKHEHSHAIEHHEITTAAKRFGITSFIYKRRRPFHPIRFSTFLQSMGQLSIKGMAGMTLNIDEQQVQKQRAVMENDQALMDARRALLRSKGFLWMAHSKSAAYFMSNAGQYMELQILGRWWADIPKNEWPAGINADIETDFEGEFGDRRQELVFIGQFGLSKGQSKEALEKALDLCLLSDQEMKDYTEISKKHVDADNFLQDHFLEQ
jgi:G3E family GTPase